MASSNFYCGPSGVMVPPKFKRGLLTEKWALIEQEKVISSVPSLNILPRCRISLTSFRTSYRQLDLPVYWESMRYIYN